MMQTPTCMTQLTDEPSTRLHHFSLCLAWRTGQYEPGLVWRILHHQRELRDKNDVIIREIRENTQLRDELRDAWRRESLIQQTNMQI